MMTRPFGSARTRRGVVVVQPNIVGTDGTSSTASVSRPAISATRYAEPMPNATTRAVFASGRAISGSTGMSFASTVSSVIDVPVTQRCLLPR